MVTLQHNLPRALADAGAEEPALVQRLELHGGPLVVGELSDFVFREGQADAHGGHLSGNRAARVGRARL